MSCILSPRLRSRIYRGRRQGVCDCCGRYGSTTSLETLIEQVLEAVESRYITMEESNGYHDDGEWSLPLVDTRTAVAHVSFQALSPCARHAAMELADGQAASTLWVRRDDNEVSIGDYLRRDWDRTRDDAQSGLTQIDAVAGDSQDRLTAVVEVASEMGLVKHLGPRQRIWRGRPVGSNDAMFTTAADLGTPPREYAAENRMSAAGVPLFYGSQTPECVRAECSQSLVSGGMSVVSIGAFAPVERIDVLDLVDVPEVPEDYFHPLRDAVPELESKPSARPSTVKATRSLRATAASSVADSASPPERRLTTMPDA